MTTTIDLMNELADICARRDETMARYDESQSDDDAREYEAAEIALQDWLDRDAPAKVAALLALREERKAQAAQRKEVAAQWAAYAKRSAASAKWLETLALQLLHRAKGVTGKPQLTLPGGRIATARTRSTRKVVITDASALPPGCLRIKREPDKVAIKNAIASGMQVHGAEVVTAETEHVTVKG